MNNLNNQTNVVRLEKTIAEAKEKFNGLLDFSLASRDFSPYKFEKQLFQMLLALGKIFLQIFFISFGIGDVGRKILNEKSEALTRYRSRSIDYTSIFGNIEVERYYYWKKGNEGICPLDESLNLPERVYSYYLQEVVVRHNVDGTYDNSAKKIEDTFSVKLSPRSIMDMMQDCSLNADDFRNQQPAPESGNDKKILVVSFDGKGVPMRKEHLAEKKTRLGRGEKNQKKKIGSVSAVYTIDKNVRNVKDILEKPKDGEKKSSPRPCGKKIGARLGDKSEKEDYIKNIRKDADKRDPEADKTKVFLCDGERFYWRMKDKYFKDYVGVLDLYHVMEKLWDLSHCFHPEESHEAKELVTLCLEMLLGGNILGCVEFMKGSSRNKKLSKSRKKTINGVIKYFERNAKNMQYERYLAMGIPIGSGNVEAACKNLVKDRMEGCGMRWCKNGADAMLALRAISLNNDLAQYFEYHIEMEKKRIYGENPRWKRAELNAISEKLAA